MTREPSIDLNTPVGDRVAQTTCYMCACRCGIKVHISRTATKFATSRATELTRLTRACSAPRVRPGSCSTIRRQGSASTYAANGEPRGSGQFEEIEWDEALRLATEWLAEVRRTDPKRLAFFTGRDQSQSLTGWWAIQYGTPNFAAHGGFCSVNMAAGGLYTFGGAFWEFGETGLGAHQVLHAVRRRRGPRLEPDQNRYLAKLKGRGAKVRLGQPCEDRL